MKKGRFITIDFRLLFLFLVLLTSCSDDEKSKGEQTSESVERVQETHNVHIRGMLFVPAEVYVNKGDKIIFTNDDPVAHNVTEEGTKAWASTDLQKEQSWELTVLESADYYCTLHPVMKGKIIVR